MKNFMMSTILQVSEFQSNILEFSSSSSESEDETRKTVIEVIIEFYDENDFKLLTQIRQWLIFCLKIPRWTLFEVNLKL